MFAIENQADARLVDQRVHQILEAVVGHGIQRTRHVDDLHAIAILDLSCQNGIRHATSPVCAGRRD
jgi:hypothetical protein